MYVFSAFGCQRHFGESFHPRKDIVQVGRPHWRLGQAGKAHGVGPACPLPQGGGADARWWSRCGCRTTAHCHSLGCIHCVLVLGDTGSGGTRRGAAREGTLRLPRVLEQTQRNSRRLHARWLVQNRYRDGSLQRMAKGSEGRRRQQLWIIPWGSLAARGGFCRKGITAQLGVQVGCASERQAQGGALLVLAVISQLMGYVWGCLLVSIIYDV